MWGRFRKMVGLGPAVPPRPDPPEHVIYAIGDIHGCVRQLDELIEQIRVDANGATAELIFLGDYIDRGPDSRGVIERLSDRVYLHDFRTVFLSGNHEAVLLDFLNGADIGNEWMSFGGAQLLASYEINAPRGRCNPSGWAEVRDQLAAAMPRHHVEFLENLHYCAERGCYFFAHAGVDPDTSFSAQNAKDMMWIREEFISDNRIMELQVVHGHTADTQPFADARRICVDTGAYATGRLTAVKLAGGEHDFLST